MNGIDEMLCDDLLCVLLDLDLTAAVHAYHRNTVCAFDQYPVGRSAGGTYRLSAHGALLS